MSCSMKNDDDDEYGGSTEDESDSNGRGRSYVQNLALKQMFLNMLYILNFSRSRNVTRECENITTYDDSVYPF